MSLPQQLTDDQYQRIQQLVLQHSGIVLADNKKQMVLGRLMRRARTLDIANVNEYLAYLESHQKSERSQFINAMTTNVTAFFRESHHFDFLREHYGADPEGSLINIWSAGGSTGQEAFSIAMTMHECERACEIFATDIDREVLAVGRDATYPIGDLSKIPEVMQHKYFLKGRKKNNGRIRVKNEVKKMVRFEYLNLLDSFEQLGFFDVIFCRNVLIYFDTATKAAIVDKFIDVLPENGILVVGHSESLLSFSDQLQHLGHTIYQKRTRH